MAHTPLLPNMIKGAGYQYFDATVWLSAILLKSTAHSSVADFKVFAEDGTESVVTGVENINKVPAGSPGWSAGEGATPTS